MIGMWILVAGLVLACVVLFVAFNDLRIQRDDLQRRIDRFELATRGAKVTVADGVAWHNATKWLQALRAADKGLRRASRRLQAARTRADAWEARVVVLEAQAKARRATEDGAKAANKEPEKAA